MGTPTAREAPWGQGSARSKAEARGGQEWNCHLDFVPVWRICHLPWAGSVLSHLLFLNHPPPISCCYCLTILRTNKPKVLYRSVRNLLPVCKPHGGGWGDIVRLGHVISKGPSISATGQPADSMSSRHHWLGEQDTPTSQQNFFPRDLINCTC